jgi:hypothetical protein
VVVCAGVGVGDGLVVTTTDGAALTTARARWIMVRANAAASGAVAFVGSGA